MKVIIVEDETIIRNGLVKHIAWENLGITEVRAAANTQEALAVCENFVPDIVLSDIAMPGENGIVLCRKLRRLFPEIEIIFLTGYADKEYLKAAIDLQAVRYVEKPVNRENISEAVQEAVLRCEQTKGRKEATMHALFINSAAYPVYNIGRKVFRVGILHMGQMDNLAEVKQRLMVGLDFWLRKNKANILVEISEPTTLSFLLGGDEELPFEEADKQEFTETVMRALKKEGRWFLALGSQVETPKCIKDSWQTALNVEKALAYMGWNHVAFPEQLRGSHKYEADGTMLERFTDAVSGKKKEVSLEILSCFLKELEDDQVFLNGDVRYLYYSLNQVVARTELTIRLSDRKDVRGGSDVDFFEYAETFAEMDQFLRNRIYGLFADSEVQKSNYAIKKVIDYIWEYYGDSSLSIKTLADHVYLTPTYLSNVFKRSIGCTIGQYIVDVRIEKAKRLMREPQLKFYQVAAMVGYEDANYFAKIFKKKTNMTPSEYKESLSVR